MSVHREPSWWCVTFIFLFLVGWFCAAALGALLCDFAPFRNSL